MPVMKFDPSLVEKGLCVNGDGNPICYPSKVICKTCMDKISTSLKDVIERLERAERAKKSTKS